MVEMVREFREHWMMTVSKSRISAACAQLLGAPLVLSQEEGLQLPVNGLRWWILGTKRTIRVRSHMAYPSTTDNCVPTPDYTFEKFRLY
ncbi:hypothetical protein P153DRAFT_367129 [Dothidotthia symphoricarpi CBS 119687]|uniref:Uncharacterized protein n=1 Tax=Dothidotthia symphoricarpi CBS 119687 TaxID=1392245 RepID=A0A6A6AB34_9PLEO|nr:uncharacterized protein P153DRAFT_367129 [Dothidotthia symphoricarpi CBS 119687]KAF2128786.1 hypothetical protein P153DRAFT_367129 [Dothidotthia symphoricarpi CBS 119687]